MKADRWVTNAPLPGFVITLPSAVSWPMALEMVTGLTLWRRMSSRLEEAGAWAEAVGLFAQYRGYLGDTAIVGHER
ncbi:hypothetical protein ACFQQB_37835 [Nonomuraea rubra]|uniref:hypothetical protein n=1 Tax=Nonomuraea rubra TaxID=46180 RepID=UPI0036160303